MRLTRSKIKKLIFYSFHHTFQNIRRYIHIDTPRWPIERFDTDIVHAGERHIEQFAKFIRFHEAGARIVQIPETSRVFFNYPLIFRFPAHEQSITP